MNRIRPGRERRRHNGKLENDRLTDIPHTPEITGDHVDTKETIGWLYIKPSRSTDGVISILRRSKIRPIRILSVMCGAQNMVLHPSIRPRKFRTNPYKTCGVILFATHRQTNRQMKRHNSIIRYNVYATQDT